MKDHLTLSVDNLVMTEPIEATEAANILSYGEVTMLLPSTAYTLLSCQEPRRRITSTTSRVQCACTGSLKYAHWVCVQRWCHEKGDVTCEICHEYHQQGSDDLCGLYVMHHMLLVVGNADIFPKKIDILFKSLQSKELNKLRDYLCQWY